MHGQFSAHARSQIESGALGLAERQPDTVKSSAHRGRTTDTRCTARSAKPRHGLMIAKLRRTSPSCARRRSHSIEGLRRTARPLAESTGACLHLDREYGYPHLYMYRPYVDGLRWRFIGSTQASCCATAFRNLMIVHQYFGRVSPWSRAEKHAQSWASVKPSSLAGHPFSGVVLLSGANALAAAVKAVLRRTLARGLPAPARTEAS